ncbi:sigma-E factor negative regulatory protein RseB [Lipingzhangella halophila]|uniref:Sigma-E factor negative regulatory protein RseB n=1 Tax=Lipingzhangella halophila TaxID=1783352 RepID=A0A7W7REC9_9ACTN|nr:sigma-E factor regulatory protein RseB domain-containing protein [Lipingzhangella halophila]MBB4929876.1 sigma-E factor negative regulatory protein RseB [Lipingzhangella halophila]
MSAGGAAHNRRRPAPALLFSALLLLLVLATSAPHADFGRPATGTDDGMDLLRSASAASRVTAFGGVQAVSARSGGALVTEHAEVVHRPGEGTGYAEIAGRSTVKAGGLVVNASAPSLRPDGRILDALERNYHVTRSGSGTAADRTAKVVEARRRDGAVAGRFWIDERTSLPLRREIYGAAGEVTHSIRFVDLAVGTGAEPLPPVSGESGLWGSALTPRERTRLTEQGWTLPEQLSWNLPLVDARSSHGPDGPVVHLAYSDGLSVVSVFVQRGRLSPKSVGTTSGMRPVIENGGTIYVDDSGESRRMWESGGFVYTVLTDAPPTITGTVVEALPGPDGSGFWARVWRGFERLGSHIGDVAGR